MSEQSNTPSRISLGALVIALLAGVGFIVLRATHPSSGRPGRYFLTVGLIIAAYFGGAMLRQHLGILTRSLDPGPPASIRIVIGTAAMLLSSTLLLPWRSQIQARVALSSIAVVLMLAAHLRPATLWNAGSTLAWRDLFGDQGTVWLCTIIGVAVLLFAWLTPLAG